MPMVAYFMLTAKRDPHDMAMIRAIILKFRMLDRLLSVKNLPQLIEVYQVNFNYLFNLTLTIRVDFESR